MTSKYSTTHRLPGTLALMASFMLAGTAHDAKGKMDEYRNAKPVALSKEAPVKRQPLEISIKNAAVKIGELVEKKLAEQKFQPNAPVADDVFLRRVYLDIIGRVPTKAEALAFLESGEKGKRAASSSTNCSRATVTCRISTTTGVLGNPLPAPLQPHRRLRPRDQAPAELQVSRRRAEQNG